jgi:3-isopropylmalate dehydrogenase
LVTYQIALIEGDGIGPEVTKASLPVLEAVQDRFRLKFEFRPSPAGDQCKRSTGIALPENSISTIKSSDACLKAPVGDTALDVIVKLRQILDLYANIRPVKSLPEVPCLRPDIDFVIVRENTEDLYIGMEFEFDGGVVALRKITRRASQMIAEHAFRVAEARNKSKRLVAVHKANVLRKSDGLFAQVCREAASRHPSVGFSEMLVDSAAMNLIRTPESFDVIVTPNVYGDIISDEAAQLVGGLGLAPSANIGEKLAIFEPVHGAAPDIAGKNIANPTAMVLTICMMLEWLSETRKDKACAAAASQVRASVNSVLKKGIKTPDLGGSSSTTEVGKEIARRVRSEV